MNNIPRLLAIVALAFTLPACATQKKACCSTSTSKCAAGDSSCQAPMAKKKVN